MSQSTYKAERRTIYLGDFPLEVAMLPNGEYRLNQTQVAEVIDKNPNSILRFLTSKHFKAISSNGFGFYHIEKKLSVEGSNKPINPVSIKVACLYWQKWAVAGNEKAQRLVLASLDRNISDLADKAFNVKRTAEEQNQAFKQNIYSDPNAYLEYREQNPDNVLEFPSKEAPNNRELELKVELAQLELEKINSLQDSYDPKEIHKLGAFSPEVVMDVKDKLKLKTTEEANSFLEEAGFGKESGKWVDIKVSGVMRVLSWNSVKELRKICSASKSRRSQQSPKQ